MKKYLIILFLLTLVSPSIAFASWWNPFSWNIFNRAVEIKVEKTITPSPSNIANTNTKQIVPTEDISPIPSTQTISKVKEVENIDLKIERCKAAKETAYNNAVQKINQAINARLEEVFNSLSQQYKDEIKRINDETDAKVSSLTGGSITYYSQYYNGRASEQLQKLHENQQTFWYTQKREIEGTKQKSIDQINLLLSEEYTRCLGK